VPPPLTRASLRGGREKRPKNDRNTHRLSGSRLDFVNPLADLVISDSDALQPDLYRLLDDLLRGYVAALPVLRCWRVNMQV